MAVRVAGTPEFERENLQISYPFSVDSDSPDQTAGAHGNVADVTLGVREYNWAHIYSVRIQRVGGVTSLTVYRGATPVVVPADQTGTDVRGDWAITEFRAGVVDGVSDYQGCVVTRSADFSEGTGVLLPGRVFPTGVGVRSIGIEGGEAQSGDVILFPDANLSARVDGQEVTLEGAEDRGCSIPAPAQYLQTINGVGPAPDGSFSLVPGMQGCIGVQPYPPGHKVNLRSDCSSPSPRKGRAASYERLLHAAAIYNLIAKAVTGVHNYTEEVSGQVENFIATRVDPPA